MSQQRRRRGGIPVDGRRIEQCKKKLGHTNESLAGVCKIEKKTVERAIKGEVVRKSTHEELTKEIGVETQIHPRRPWKVSPKSKEYRAYRMLLDDIFDGAIPPDHQNSLIEYLVSSQRYSGLRMLRTEFTALLDGMEHRGHVWKSHDGKFRVCEPSPNEIKLTLELRADMEVSLARDAFGTCNSDELERILKEMDRCLDAASECFKENHAMDYIDYDVQFHLAWCHRFHTARLVMLSLIRTSQLAVATIIRSENSKPLMLMHGDLVGIRNEFERLCGNVSKDFDHLEQLIRSHVDRTKAVVEKQTKIDSQEARKTRKRKADSHKKRRPK